MFMHAEDITGDEALCPACCTFTCTICKGYEHTGDCPEDTATKEVLDLAAKEGWRRCGKCSRMIDLKVGCNHITFVFHPSLSMILTVKDALVKPNGAICAARNGKSVLVHSGMNTDSTTEQSRSPLANQPSLTYGRHNALQMWPSFYETGMSALMLNLTRTTATTNVKSAEGGVICTSTLAANAGSKSALLAR